MATSVSFLNLQLETFSQILSHFGNSEGEGGTQAGGNPQLPLYIKAWAFMLFKVRSIKNHVCRQLLDEKKTKEKNLTQYKS